MRAYVEQRDCMGCGMCSTVARWVFRRTENGKAEAYVDTTPENQRDVDYAIRTCPVGAIRQHE